MSDDWIILIPEDPTSVPDEARQHLARDYILRIAANADEVELVNSDTPRFFDCGANLSKVSCPICQVDLMDWWADRMDDEHQSPPKLRLHRTPCWGLRSR